VTVRSAREDANTCLPSMRGNDCEVSRQTGVPRSTIRDWRSGKNQQLPRTASTECSHDFTLLRVKAYAYLLGVYLGDGCLSRAPRGVWRLRVTMDVRYPAILDECCRAMEAVMPGKRAHRYRRVREPGCVEVSMYSKHWPCLLPQHGPGKKHLRKIAFTPWQERIVSQAHENFVRGLIHSDGCRVIANDRGVASTRYYFSNLSEDIKILFCNSLEALGIAWTRPSDRQIAIYRRSAVAALDEFIGPKR